MHQALLVPEIIMNIFEHAKMGVHAKKPLSQKALAALATTCKIFYEPAMDLLWSDIDGLLPLLGCITRLQPMIYPTAEVSAGESIQARCPFLVHHDLLTEHLNTGILVSEHRAIIGA